VARLVRLRWAKEQGGGAVGSASAFAVRTLSLRVRFVPRYVSFDHLAVTFGGSARARRRPRSLVQIHTL